MKYTTPRGTTVHFDKPAKASFATILNDNGRPVPDNLKLTGSYRTYTEFREDRTEFECIGTFDTFYVSEDFLIQ